MLEHAILGSHANNFFAFLNRNDRVSRIKIIDQASLKIFKFSTLSIFAFQIICFHRTLIPVSITIIHQMKA